jgi:ribosomal 30S subunit maturation factor RimM
MLPKIQKKSPNTTEDPTELFKTQLLAHYQQAQKENASLNHQNRIHQYFHNFKELKDNKAKEIFSNPLVEVKKEALSKLHQEEQ